MHPLIERYVAGQLPEAMALSLVGGALPLPPGDLLEGLAHAVFSGSSLSERALETLASLPASLVEGGLGGNLENPDVLGLVLIHRPEAELKEMALLHRGITAEWIERAVPHLPGSLLDIVLNNQVMWLQRPAILDLAELHPEAEYSIKRRVNEFRFHVLKLIPQELAQERLEILDDVEAGRLDIGWASLPLPVEKPVEEAEEEEPNAVRERLSKPIIDFDGNQVSMSLTQRVMKLRTNQKIMLAIKGGKEERTLLIREANRLIQVNVMRNPRITESEVAYIANMRTVNEEVLRIISMTRDWMKKYVIVKALVMNPRTPIAIALSNLKRLIEADLKLLMRDKNVPELLRRETKRYLQSKADGGKG
jgi:hypothetical protein